jgi:hypothetical protein
MFSAKTKQRKTRPGVDSTGPPQAVDLDLGNGVKAHFDGTRWSHTDAPAMQQAQAQIEALQARLVAIEDEKRLLQVENSYLVDLLAVAQLQARQTGAAPILKRPTK